MRYDIIQCSLALAFCTSVLDLDPFAVQSLEVAEENGAFAAVVAEAGRDKRT